MTYLQLAEAGQHITSDGEVMGKQKSCKEPEDVEILGQSHGRRKKLQRVEEVEAEVAMEASGHDSPMEEDPLEGPSQERSEYGGPVWGQVPEELTSRESTPSVSHTSDTQSLRRSLRLAQISSSVSEGLREQIL